MSDEARFDVLVSTWWNTGVYSQSLIAVDDEAMTIEGKDGSRRFALREIASGTVFPGEGRARLQLQVVSGVRVGIETRDVAEATSLLTRLKLDAAHHTHRFVIHGLLVRWYFGAVAAAFGFSAMVGLAALATAIVGPDQPIIGLLALVFGVAAAIYAAKASQRLLPDVVVGADGIRIGRRFIAHADIVEQGMTTVKAQRGPYVTTQVAVTLRSGETRVVASFMHDGSMPNSRAQALALRIEQARLAIASTPEALAELLDPRTDDVAQVRGFVADLVQRISNYRDVALSRDDILGVAANPTTAPKRRIAAAMLYSQLYGKEGAAQMRVAAETVVNEPMRIALEQVADGNLDDETIDRVLKA
ncbi:MAG: hypothetical protein ABI175_24585 [Polyangiales bacterium]